MALLGACVLACEPPVESSPTGAPSSATSGGSPHAVDDTFGPAPSREGSSIARTSDDTSLIIADEDHKQLVVVSLPLQPTSTTTPVAMPGHPAHVLITRDLLLVTVRDISNTAGALLVMKKEGETYQEAQRIELPYDAWGIGLTPDENRAVVSSPWSNQLSVVDLVTMKVVSTLDVGREPRGIAVLPDGERAYVSHLVGSSVTRLDNLTTEPSTTSIELPAGPSRSAPGDKLPASLGYTVALSPDGSRAFFPRHALGALGGDAWFGTAAVDVLVTADDTGLAPTTLHGYGRAESKHMDEIPLWMRGDHKGFSKRGARAFVQPRAAVYRKKTQTLLVASEGTDAIVELDALMSAPTFGVIRTHELPHRRDPIFDTAKTGGAPTGIVLSSDEQIAFVHCRSTDEVLAVQLIEGDGAYATVPPEVVRIAAPPDNESYDFGRKLFYNATDTVTSDGLACAGCHPEGRDDGHVWHETSFVQTDDPREVMVVPPRTIFLGSNANARALIARWGALQVENVDGPEDAFMKVGYPRQTPMLAGRVKANGPYGWHAESPTLVKRIIAGFGLHRWTQSEAETPASATARAAHIAEFIRNGLVAPAKRDGELSELEKKGEAIFKSDAAQCATCHIPASEYTDRSALPLRKRPPEPAFAKEEDNAFKTPSLFYVGHTPPYFHDGREPTLDALIDNNADAMGRTSHLSEEEKTALVAFLRTL